MKKDIENRADIELLLQDFYSVVMRDLEIGHHFTGLDLNNHLPVIADFWEKILFGKPVYFGNPLVAHKKLNEISPLKPEHFAQWVKIFCEKVDANFQGEKAAFAKERAQQIAQSLYFRVANDLPSDFHNISK